MENFFTFDSFQSPWFSSSFPGANSEDHDGDNLAASLFSAIDSFQNGFDSANLSSASNTSTSSSTNDSPPASTPTSFEDQNHQEEEENVLPEIQPRLTAPARVARTNYCETVAVDSSAHVAQIVGKNGCKIKHLRAKFGTYIHTPSATDEPVFIIKGQRDKVLEVKQEIIKADNHFSLIKMARNLKISQMIDSKDATCIRLYIPTKYIGLVVGRNGWFVKDLQRRYQVYIETPKFELCNYFQLYGSRQTVMTVKRLIHQQILKKTGVSYHEKQDGDDIYYVE